MGLRLYTFRLSLILILSFIFIGSGYAEANKNSDKKVTLCHQSNSGFHSINVNKNAAQAHYAHGDYDPDSQGSCSVSPEPEPIACIELSLRAASHCVPGGPVHLPGDLFGAGGALIVDFMSPATTINGNYFFQDEAYNYWQRYFLPSQAQQFQTLYSGADGTGDAGFQRLGLQLNTWDADIYQNAQYANLGQILKSGYPVTVSLFKEVVSTGAYSRRIVQFETLNKCSPLDYGVHAALPDAMYCDLRSDDETVRLLLEYKLERRLNNGGAPYVAVLGSNVSENLAAYRETKTYSDVNQDSNPLVVAAGRADSPIYFASMAGQTNPTDIRVGIDILFDSGIMLTGELTSPLTAFADEALSPDEFGPECLDPAGSLSWSEAELNNSHFLSSDIKKGCYEHSSDRTGFHKTQIELTNPDAVIPIAPPGQLYLRHDSCEDGGRRC